MVSNLVACLIFLLTKWSVIFIKILFSGGRGIRGRRDRIVWLCTAGWQAGDECWKGGCAVSAGVGLRALEVSVGSVAVCVS